MVGGDQTLAKSSDPGWKYCTIPDPNRREKVKCKFCGHISNGGIFRLKKHLAGQRGDVNTCQKVDADAKREITEYLDKFAVKKNKRAQELKDLRGEVEIDKKTDDVVDIGDRQLKKPKVVGQLDTYLFKNPEEIVKERVSSKQTTITDKLCKERRARTCQYIARWIYEAGIPMNTVNLNSFQVMLEAIGQFGPGLKGPSYYELREPLLRQEVETTKDSLALHREEWKRSGCSLMTDAWTDKRKRSIMNICVNSRFGTYFLKAVDCSDEIHNADYIFNLVDDAIELVGEENIVQVVTDNAPANLAAGRLLQEKRPMIFWTPCVAHCIDLMLEAIGKLTRVQNIIKKAKTLTIFIYSHHLTLSIMRSFLGRDLVRPGVTRFATTFLSLESLLKNMSNLRRMFVSEEWLNCKFSKTPEGIKAAATIGGSQFWRGVELVLKIFKPLVNVLRLVDGEKTPAMGYIQQAMIVTLDELDTKLADDEPLRKQVFQIVQQKWDNKLNRPLHAAGYYLNPILYWKDPEIDSNNIIMDGLMECIETFYPEPDIQDGIIMKKELPMYRDGSGSFGRAAAIRQRDDIQTDPVQWWINFGCGTPYLQKMAIRVLNLTCTSSGCERNWSTFEMIHTKRRNRLDVKRLEALVFIQFNAKLKERRDKHEKDCDPIESEDRDKAKDWIVELGPDEEEIYPGVGLMWGEVAKDSGAEEVVETRKSTRNTTSKVDTKKKENEEYGDVQTDWDDDNNMPDDNDLKDIEASLHDDFVFTHSRSEDNYF